MVWVGLAALLLTVALLLAASWCARRLVVVSVTGHSMAPAFQEGDTVIVRRAPLAALRAGDVVVLHRPGIAAPAVTRIGAAGRRPRFVAGDWMIKRVAAVAGQPAPAGPRFDRDGELVPTGRVAVLGDNRARSHDSRHFGYLTADDILGIVCWRVRAATGPVIRP
jgi:signal peptidase I